jgi:hypothetical protein
VGWAETGELALQLATGIGLAACAGLRAFLPLLVVGLAGRFELVTLSQSYDWLSGWPALMVFGVAVAVEIAGDKFPVVDHLLDTIQTFVKPCAGALLTASVVSDWSPLGLTVVWIITGGATAGIVHLAKAKLRVISTATTAGLGNPALSVAEDVAVVAGSAVSLAAPVLLLLLFGVGTVVGWLVLRRRSER